MILEFPSPSKISAVVKLLADEDPSVVEACRAQLVQWGEIVRDDVERANREGCARTRVAARCVLRSLDLSVWTARLCDLGARVSKGERDDDLLREGVALFLRLARPGGDVEAVEARIDELIEGARRVVAGRSMPTAARELAAYLGGAQGFRGCAKSYYRPENLFLDQVLERRRGLPIALVALYLLVGRGAGLDLTAVRLPEYFLVRVHGRRPVLLDPFHAGRSVTKADCFRFLRSVGTAKPASSWLKDMDDIDVLLGMMSTLGRVHDHREDREFREALQRAQRSLSLL